MARRKSNNSTTVQKYDYMPKNLDDHPFYGLKLDEAQREYRNAIYDPQYDVVFCNSSAGSGKSLLAVATALLMCRYEDGYDGIVYMSAAGVAEHKQGLLPGTLQEKSQPLAQPLYQAVLTLGEIPEQIIANDQNIMARKTGTALITTMTNSYIRDINIGSEDHRVIYIIDEAQNFTVEGLKTALTRVNDGSKTIVIGHDKQCDLKYPNDSGFVRYLKHFEPKPWCKVCHLTKNYRGRVAEHADSL